jgi:hypothetical protein
MGAQVVTFSSEYSRRQPQLSKGDASAESAESGRARRIRNPITPIGRINPASPISQINPINGVWAWQRDAPVKPDDPRNGGARRICAYRIYWAYRIYRIYRAYRIYRTRRAYRQIIGRPGLEAQAVTFSGGYSLRQPQFSNRREKGILVAIAQLGRRSLLLAANIDGVSPNWERATHPPNPPNPAGAAIPKPKNANKPHKSDKPNKPDKPDKSDKWDLGPATRRGR